MKTKIFTLFLGLFFVLSSSSAQSVALSGFNGRIDFSGFANSGPNIQGTLKNFTDQTGQYIASQIDTGDIAWDQNGKRYAVVGVISSTATQAVVVLSRIGGGAHLPKGIGLVSRETPNGLTLIPTQNSAGISALLLGRILTNNMEVMRGWGNGIISALPSDSVGITSNHPLRISNGNGFSQFKDGKIFTNWKDDNVIISAYPNRKTINNGATVSVGCCEDSMQYGGVLVGMYSSLKSGGVGYFSTVIGYNSEADSAIKVTLLGSKNATYGVRTDAAIVGNYVKLKGSNTIGAGNSLNFNHNYTGLFGNALTTTKDDQYIYGINNRLVDHTFIGNIIYTGYELKTPSNTSKPTNYQISGKNSLEIIFTPDVTTAVILPEIVNGTPGTNQVNIGYTLYLIINRAANIPISRSGSDVIYQNGQVGSSPSITTTSGTFFTRTFIAISADTWAVF